MNDGQNAGLRGTDDAAMKSKAKRLESLQTALLASGIWSWCWKPASDHLHLDHPLWKSEDGPLPLSDFLRKTLPDQREQLAGTLQRLSDEVRHGHSETVEFTASDEDGNEFIFSLTALAEPAEAGSDAIVGVLRDITTRRRQQLEMQESVTAATRASQLKSDFLAMMSHEIRTQLNAVIGMAEMLLSSGLEERQRVSLGIIHEAGLALSTIVNDALDLSKIEAGKLDVERRPFKVKDLVGRVLEGNIPRASAKGIALTSHVADLPPSQLLGDEHRLRQILNNLLNNALKFTEKGSISLDCRIIGKHPEERELLFSVRDTGIGIPEDRLQNLFQEFNQLDVSVSRQYGGTGLGLAICKRLAELMGGRIGVESEAGRGSNFWFTIPLQTAADQGKDEAPAVARTQSAPAMPPASPPTDGLAAMLSGNAAAVAARSKAAAARLCSPDPSEHPGPLAAKPEAPLQKQPASPPGARQAHLLVVDDNKMNQTVISALLLRTGYRLDVVDSGAAAIEAAKSGNYDLILMDVHMPGMDGLEATRRIRAMGDRWAEVPILALTADQGEECRLACEEAGMNGFLNKPVDKSRVMEAVEKAVAGDADKAALRAAG